MVLRKISIKTRGKIGRGHCLVHTKHAIRIFQIGSGIQATGKIILLVENITYPLYTLSIWLNSVKLQQEID